MDQQKGKWYYLDSSGAMKTGWNNINDKWYYLNDSGVMLTGWRHAEYPGVYENDPYWNYFNSSGEFITDSDVMGSTAGYNTFGNHKNNKGITLTYSISLSKHPRSNVISGANLWNNTSNFKGKLTLTSSNANITVTEDALSNMSDIAVTNMYSGFANLIDVDPEKENWNKSEIVLNTRTNVPISSIAHEFGHAMGLSHHITKRDSIMTQLRFKRSVSAPTYYDANILSNIY